MLSLPLCPAAGSRARCHCRPSPRETASKPSLWLRRPSGFTPNRRVLGPAATVAGALLLDGATPDAALLDVNLRGETVAPVGRSAAGAGRSVRAGERLRRRAAHGGGPGRGISY